MKTVYHLYIIEDSRLCSTLDYANVDLIFTLFLNFKSLRMSSHHGKLQLSFTIFVIWEEGYFPSVTYAFNDSFNDNNSFPEYVFNV